VINGIETAFGVQFQDSEITDESTFDDVHNALVMRLGSETSDRCLTSIVFWRLRRALIQMLDLPKGAIKPSIAIETLIPPFHRRRTWSSMSEEVGLRLPGLEYPCWFTTVMLLISFAPSVAAILLSGTRFRWLLPPILAVPLWATLVFRVGKPFATAVPKHSWTVGETARTIVGLNYAKLVQELGLSHPTELRSALRYVVTDITGVGPHSLQENTRLLDFVETTLLRPQI
jgi:hypothetical protein